MSNARFSNQRIMYQYIGKFGQFSHSAAAVQCAIVCGCNTRAVIAAVFQTFQGVHQNWRGLMAA
jgi:hypothetical protein